MQNTGTQYYINLDLYKSSPLYCRMGGSLYHCIRAWLLDPLVKNEATALQQDERSECFPLQTRNEYFFQLEGSGVLLITTVRGLYDIYKILALEGIVNLDFFKTTFVYPTPQNDKYCKQRNTEWSIFISTHYLWTN